MNWLNPVNWVKKGVASAVNAKVDEYVTTENATAAIRHGVNEVAKLAMSKASDETIAKTANGLKVAGEALAELGKAISPEGDGGREITAAEFFAICDKLDNAFGDIVPEGKVAELRAYLKGKVAETLGVA